jgi:hypothetical protein
MIHFARFSRGLLVLAVLLFGSSALGAVKLVGSWPETDKLVTLDASALPKSEAVRRIADGAGWNVVWASPSTEPIDIHVKKQPATKVLELVLSDGDYVARREGDLIQIERAKAVADAPVSAPPAIPPPPAVGAPPFPSAPPSVPSAAPDASSDDDDDSNPAPSQRHHKKHHPDRTVLAGTLRVEKGETVNDVSVLSGYAAIYGDVKGDVTILGGNAHLYPGAHVYGDIGMMGGSLRLDDGSVIDGDVEVVGGAVDRAPGAQIHGQVSNGTARGHDDEHEEKASKVKSAARTFGGSVTRTAMLFVFGAILLALVTRRMGYLEGEVVERPMRSFALGIVGFVTGLVLAVLLCVTVIGIPVAVVGILVAFIAAFAGICAVLTAVGDALLRRWTNNPYLYLAAGCALYLIIGFIPYVGPIVTWLVVPAIGIGSLVATRAAGYIPPRGGFTAPPPAQTVSPA